MKTVTVIISVLFFLSGCAAVPKRVSPMAQCYKVCRTGKVKYFKNDLLTCYCQKKDKELAL